MDISRNHFICLGCDTDFWTDFYYPGRTQYCESCRKKQKMFDQAYYEALWKERGETKRYR